MQQVVLCASSGESTLVAWDVHTGTQLTSYKGNSSDANGLSRLGPDCFMAAQNSKEALQIWAWHKDTAVERCFVPERLTSLCGSRDGRYVAGGGASGSIYLWDAASGQLLRSWQAHYKAVSSLCFAERGCVLLSGGLDTLALVWGLAEVLRQQPGVQVRPLHSWAEHTLPITCICCGCEGASASSLIVTASLDHSLKLWSLGDGKLLRTVQLPTTLHCVALDPGEHAVYAGGGDGSIYEVSLVSANPADLAAGGSSALPYATLQGHSRLVTSLALSLDAELLVSGSEDGSVRVWDVRSRQQVRQLQSVGKMPVTGLLLLQRPPFLTPSGAQGGSAQGGRAGPKRPMPLATLAKYPGTPGSMKPWEGSAVVVDGRYRPASISQRSGLAALCGEGEATMAAGSTTAMMGEDDMEAEGDGAIMAASDHPGSEAAALQQELQAARALALQWRGMHRELQQLCVQHLMAPPG